jgi:hypothetical protein
VWINRGWAILFPASLFVFSTAENGVGDRESPPGRLGGNGRVVQYSLHIQSKPLAE